VGVKNKCIFSYFIFPLPLIPSHQGREVCLKYKGLEYWSNGVMEDWSIGVLE
jgi:hypothetical protein